MKKSILLSILIPFLLFGLCIAQQADREWHSYVVPGYGSFTVEVPASWKEEIRQSDANLPPTIIFRAKKDGGFELLLTPIPPQEGKQPTLEKIEASLMEAGGKHLASARQETLTLEKLKGEQVTGRYFLLTEKNPPPGEYPSVISGGFLTGPIAVSFTLLLHDPQAEYVKEALRVVGSARLRRGQGGKYHATLDDLRLSILLAKAAGLVTEIIEDQSKSYKVKLDSFLLEAGPTKGGINVWLDGSDFQRAGELLKALTMNFQEIH
jgi:hypothetical protein